jgi:hypothetical protein
LICDPCYVIRSKNQKKIPLENGKEVTWLNKNCFPAIMINDETSEGLLKKGIRGFHIEERDFQDEEREFVKEGFIEQTSEMKRKEMKLFEESGNKSAKDPSELKARALTEGNIIYKFDLATFVD